MAADEPVKSPCISVCALDESDLCIGCYRTVAEITRWARMDGGQRRMVLVRCREREKQLRAPL